MNMQLKPKISHMISRTLGSLSFIRLIEWKEILGVLQPKNGEKVLDVACGSGGLSLKIAKRGGRVHGVDRSVDSIKRANLLGQKQGCSFLVADVEQLPYDDNYFNKVVCSSSLEHFSNDAKALKEMNRVLKANGIIVLTTDSLSYPSAENLKKRHAIQYHVVSYYNSDQILKKLEQSGFNLLSSKYIFNSALTSFFYKLSVVTYDKFYRHLLVFLLGNLLIPLFLISDRLVGKKNCGYTLLVKGEKR